MMASAQMAAMLDELMGRNRNVNPSDNVREMEWGDPEVCKFYLVHLCPNDLFVNTKVDLGPCGKIHDDALRDKYVAEPVDHYKKGQYQDEFLRFCSRMLTELQTRIRRAKERLHLTQTEDIPLNASGIHRDTEEKVKLLSTRINQLVEDAEQNGNDGKVETAQGLMKLSDTLREEREALIKSMNPFYGGRDDFSAQQKAMQVCDTCGAFLIVGDAQQRVDDHLTGKQHIGYARLKEATDFVEERRRQQRVDRDREMDERRKQRERDRELRKVAEGPSKEREIRKAPEGPSRERKRSRDRDDKRSSTDRKSSSSSSSRRRRSRSRDKERRDRGSGDHRRRRSRSRSRDRSSKRRSSDKSERRRSEAKTEEGDSAAGNKVTS